ncbi:MAG TPA: shikimate dehydrogenase [Tepidisphaeraceae bacterium]|nr:shikimate dehydrogenase [Tepidisphaeraceae bacterium]
MSLLCVAIFAEDVLQTRRAVARAAEAGADLVELRIDRVRDGQVVKEIEIGELPVPAVVTCRPVWEGGEYEGSEEERLSLLRVAAECGAKYVDLELAAFAKNQMADRGIGIPLIVSSHDFSGRPERLYNLLAEINAHHAAVAKIVWAARSVRDNLEAFELLKARQKPTITFCMGEAGLISRILARKFGSFLSFASLDIGAGTAPGQLSISDMKNLYRWDAISEKTKVYGVVAEPVGHSMSPAIHNAAFSAVKHDGVYVPFLVRAGYESFKAFMESFLNFQGMDLSGLSITLPHKENALRYLIEKNADIEDLARRIGAVNTIVIGPDGNLRGINTDYAAILDSIAAKLSISWDRLAGKKVAVIGAGGTGRTAVAALAHVGADVTVFNRTVQRAQDLAHEFNNKSGNVRVGELERISDSKFDIYFNATSVGMSPNIDATPIPHGRIPGNCVVFDTIYNPIETLLLKEAQGAGAKIISGVEMFLRQAVGQFRAWTGLDAPVDLMREVIIGRLKK